MDFKFFRNRIKVSLYSIGIFAFFLLVSLVSLYIVREKILDNSHIMGQQLAARFATRETGRIKAQEILLRSAAQNLAHMLEMKPDMTDTELEEALTHFTDYMEKNADVGRFDMCAVVHGHLIGKRLEGQPTDVASLKWYQAALSNQSGVAYTNLYQYGKNNERLLTMAVRFSDNNVLAMNLYPERLNGLLSDNKLPKDSYYYLCDPSGNIMFTINDRNLSIEEEQPYVDKIFKEIRNSGSDVSYITDYDGNKRGVYYKVSEKGWISIVTIPYDFLMGDYKDLMQWFSLTLAIFLLLAAGLALREHLLNRELQSINEVIRVMSKSFLAVFRVNYITGRYYMLKSTPPGPQEPEGDYDELLQELIKNVEPEATEEFATSFAREHIKDLVERHINDFGGEFRYRFGKEYRWLNVRLMRDDLLNEDEAVFFFREVEAEKQKELEHLQLTEQALQVARENAKSRNMFFSALSHDMRAPLNGIIGMAELAELHKDDCGQVKEYIRKISAAGQQLLTLINDILEMARLDNGKVEHVQETFMIAKVAQDTSDIFAAQAELRDLRVEIVVHRLRSAHEDAVFPAAVFADEIGGDEAVFIAGLLLVGKDVDDMDLTARRGDLLQFFLVYDALLGARAVEDREIKILQPVAQSICHAHERRDADAAGERHDLFRVAQPFIVELPLRSGDRELLPDLPRILHPRRDKAVRVAPHRDVVFAALCPRGAAAERVGAARERAADVRVNADILPRPVRRERRAVLGFENDGLYLGTVLPDLGNDDVLRFRMADLRLLVCRERFRQRRCARCLDRRFADLGHILEPEHIERPDQLHLIVAVCRHVTQASSAFISARVFFASVSPLKIAEL